MRAGVSGSIISLNAIPQVQKRGEIGRRGFFSNLFVLLAFMPAMAGWPAIMFYSGHKLRQIRAMKSPLMQAVKTNLTVSAAP